MLNYCFRNTTQIIKKAFLKFRNEWCFKLQKMKGFSFLLSLFVELGGLMLLQVSKLILINICWLSLAVSILCLFIQIRHKTENATKSNHDS